ncbi:MAG: hypothetical protein QME14_05360 [Methanobacteriaceae archaeon]|nr:hypothetical protein [Methanobacteriaceae archaeon]
MMRDRLIKALATIPIVTAFSMSGSCAAGCPYGLVNDPYPGHCPRYIDINGDGLCDLSQATTATTDTSTSSSDDDTVATDSIDDSTNGRGHDVDVVDDPQNASSISDTGDIDGNLSDDGGGYYLLPISLLLISGYLFTHYLFSKGILSPKKHRRLWNLFVTAGYLGTGVTGVILTFMVNMGVKTALNPSITFWHAEFAILMVIGTLIHIHLYWKPFKNIFKVLFGFKTFKGEFKRNNNME